MQDVRFGVLGTARIATKVGAAIREARGAALVAIGSRSLDSALAWASAVAPCRSTCLEVERVRGFSGFSFIGPSGAFIIGMLSTLKKFMFIII